MMAPMPRQGDLTNVDEVHESALPLKRPADEASPKCVQKRRAMDNEIECRVVQDEDDVFSKQLSQPITAEDEIRSRVESHNPQCPVESLQSWDYWDPEIRDEDAERLVTVHNFTFDPVILRRELAKMIILHEYPLSVVDHIGFRDFLGNLNPVFRMVSQNTVENDIMKIFKIERCIAHSELSGNSSGKAAITTKMWTSSDGNRRFLAITGHIIDEEWKRQSFIMRFANVPLPYTNETISKVILDCFSYFDVDEKLSTITVDSYTSDNKLTDILLEKLSGSKLFFREKLFRLPCFARTLSLMVKDGFDVARHVIEKIRDSIMFWTSSPERETTLEKSARESGVISTTKLVLDHGPSWRSTYLMLQESFALKDVFYHLGQQESRYDSLPTEKEWDLVGEVCNRLQFLYDETEALATCPASCMYLIHLCGIKTTLTEWLDCDVPWIKEMTSKMLETFDKYWLEARDLLGVASVFHPNCQFLPMEHFFPIIYGNEAESEVERIRKIFYGLFDEYKRSLRTKEPTDEELRSRLSRIEYRLAMYRREIKKNEPEHCEVDKYLNGYFEEEAEDVGILSWWGGRKTRYPVLHKMAKDILAIPIFSVDEENTFDVGDKILGENRSGLGLKMIEALMCNQRWLKRQKNSDSNVSLSATCAQSLGTIFDDANAEYGIIIKSIFEDG